MPQEDQSLIERLRGGEQDAFEQIDRKYRLKICVFLSRYTKCPSHAEEIAQRTLIKAFEAIDSLRAPQRLGSWLYQIAFRLIVDEQRKKSAVSMAESFEIEDKSSDPARIAQQREEKENLWSKAEQILSGDEFTAVWLKYAENEKVETIAEIMSRTPGSVRVLLFRARNKLLEHLTPNER